MKNHTPIVNGVLALAMMASIAIAFTASWKMDFAIPRSPAQWTLVLGPVLGALLCMALLRAPATWRTSAVICGVFCVVGIYAAEFWIAQQGQTKAQYLTALRRDGASIFPAVLPNDFVQATSRSKKLSMEIDGRAVFPLSGISDTETLLCREGAGWVQYRSDMHGFRNPPDVWQERPTIAAIGDSFTQGYCVHAGNTLPDLIRQRFAKTVNLGFGGNGPLLELATLKEYAAPLKPRVVLWFFTDSNDMGNLNAEKNIPTLMKYVDENFRQDLEKLRPRIDASLRSLADDALHAALDKVIWDRIGLRDLRLRLHLTNQKLDEAENEPTPDFALFERILADARHATESWGGRFIFVYLPSRNSLDLNLPETAEIRTNVVAALDRQGIEWIDGLKPLQSTEDHADLFPEGFGHFSARGYQLLGRIVLDHLASLNLRSPRN